MDETTNQVSVTITANGDGTFIVEQNDQENPQENMEEGGVEEQKAFKSLDEALNKVRELLSDTSEDYLNQMFNAGLGEKAPAKKPPMAAQGMM